MSTLLDETSLRTEVEAYSLDRLLAAVGAALEYEGIFSLGATTGRMRHSLPGNGHIYNSGIMCKVLLESLAREISSGQYSTDKNQSMYSRYYDILKLKRTIDQYLKDTELVSSISFDYRERSITEQQNATVNTIRIALQEDE